MKLGYHVGSLEALADLSPELYLGCYQLDVNDYGSYHFNMSNIVACESTLVLHGPFVTSFLTNDNNRWERSYTYLTRMTDYAMQNKIRYLVFHPGGLADKQSVEEGKDRLQTLLRRWYSVYFKSDVILCIENKVGGPKDMGTCAVLKDVLESEPDLLNVAMCLDTQHAWASGELKDVIAQWDSYRELVRVVHLNSIPRGNVYGGRKDSHSTVCLRDSDTAGLVLLEFFLQKGVVDERIPVILERNTELVIDDVLFIQEKQK